MATISKLVVALSANSAKLVSELAKSRKRVDSWAKQIRSSATVVAKVLAATGAAAAGSIVAIVNGQAGAIDQLAKKARQFDIDTSALQRLRFEVQQTSEVTSGQLDPVLQRMVRRVAEAAKGTGEAKDAIRELGLDASKLAGLSTDKQFHAIADAMKRIGSAGDQTRLTMKIFDTEGVALVNSFNANLEAVGQEFDSLGIKITSQQAAMVEAYNDSKGKLSTLWDGFLNQITVAVAPAFQSVIEWITATTKEMGGMGMIAEKVVGGMATGVGFVADAFTGLRVVVAGIQVLFGELAQIALRSIGSIYDGYVALRQLLDEDFKGSDFFSGLADGFQHETDKIKTELSELTSKELPSVRIKRSLEESRSRLDSVQAGPEKSAEVQKNLIDSTVKTAKSIDKLGESVSKTSTGMSDLYKKLFGESGQNKGGKDDGKAGEKTFAAQPRQIRDINFESYARAAKVAKDAGNTAEFNRQIGFANDQAGRSAASTFSYDAAGQRDVLNRLSGGNGDKIGSVEFKIEKNSVTLSGEPGEAKGFIDALTSALSGEAKRVSVA